jgi:hypothetical protein
MAGGGAVIVFCLDAVRLVKRFLSSRQQVQGIKSEAIAG